MAERLGVVTELLAAARVDLVREQTPVVRTAREPVEELPRALELAGLREASRWRSPPTVSGSEVVGAATTAPVGR